MPNLNILTWNSRGESPAKAAFLQNLILHNSSFPGWQPDVIIIQEAMANAGGAIWNMLAGLGGVAGGGNYTLTAPQFVGIGGEGYILKVSNPVTLALWAFQAVNLAADPGVVAAIGMFPPGTRPTATAAVAAMRKPGAVQLTFGGRLVRFMTWHAPRGPGQILLGTSASVNYDAYFFLQSSNFYAVLGAPGASNLSITAGDLNVTDAQLGAPTGLPHPINGLFPNWAGISSRLDHVLARRDGGGAGIGFPTHGAFGTGGLSDHDVLLSTVQWP
jgi:hypothetical protein